jgi:hypothetical protein
VADVLIAMPIIDKSDWSCGDYVTRLTHRAQSDCLTRNVMDCRPDALQAIRREMADIVREHRRLFELLA